MTGDEDLKKIYAELHHQLVLMENVAASQKVFGGLSGSECITAHYILESMDKALKARWEADGSPEPERFH